MIWDFLTKIDTNKIELIVRYGFRFTYADGRTYKGANGDDSVRIIDDKEPIPIKVGHKYSAVFGVNNGNARAIDDVMLFIQLPRHFKVKKYHTWTDNSNGQYYISVGTVHSELSANAQGPIEFIAERTGKHPLVYIISSRDFKTIKRTRYFDIYDNAE